MKRLREKTWSLDQEDDARYFELGGMKPGPRSFSKIVICM